MFKVGQEVVYLGVKHSFPNTAKEPQINSIQIISGILGLSNEGVMRYSLIGFEYGYCGTPQAFWETILRPLDYDFVEEVIKQVEPKEELV